MNTDFIFINKTLDLVRLMFTNEAAPEENTEEIARALKSLAAELDFPIILMFTPVHLVL